MSVIKIKTARGNYEVNGQNQIHQPELNKTWRGLGLPSETCLLEGAVEIRFNQIYATYTVQEIRLNKVPWKWPSGRQRCFILERNNGRVKMWNQDAEVKVELDK